MKSLNIIIAGITLISTSVYASDQRGLLAYLNVKKGTEAEFLEAAKEVIKK